MILVHPSNGGYKEIAGEGQPTNQQNESREELLDQYRRCTVGEARSEHTGRQGCEEEQTDQRPIDRIDAMGQQPARAVE